MVSQVGSEIGSEFVDEILLNDVSVGVLDVISPSAFAFCFLVGLVLLGYLVTK